MEENKLPDLPASSDENFWLDGYKQRIELKPPEKCEHRFIGGRGHEVICKKCNIGFIVGAPFKLKDGRIYHENKLVI